MRGQQSQNGEHLIGVAVQKDEHEASEPVKALVVASTFAQRANDLMENHCMCKFSASSTDSKVDEEVINE